MEEAVVLYPTPPIGHLRAMVELGKVLLNHQPSLSIHVLIATPPYQADATAPYIAAVSSSIPAITFHRLPEITLPPSSNVANHEDLTDLTIEVLDLSNPYVHDALVSISNKYKIQALVMDFFIKVAFKVATELNIRPYYFFTSAAGSLASFLYLPTLHKEISTKSFKDLDAVLHIPGVPPFPAKDVPNSILDRTKKACEFFIDCSITLSKAAGIIINTFEALEPRVIKAIGDGRCVPDAPTPPLYCIGPLIASADEKNSGSGAGDHLAQCLTWLDLQPSKSVVYLCFGSLGLFSMEQLREIALGLERSEQRFLWVVRNPPSGKLGEAIKEEGEPDLNALLPEGFLERTNDRGLVVKSWAPQVAVLNHDSVGGFVTHCGWNSVLESVTVGVPMVAWPLYSEQNFNRMLLVDEMKIALSMVESESGFVNSDEVERRVRDLMESNELGKVVREEIAAMKDEAKAALSEGGSTRVAVAKLVESWKHE